MDMKVVLVLIGLAAACAVYYFVFRKKQVRSMEWRIGKISDKRTRNSGLQIWRESSADTPFEGEMMAIERGITDAFTRARCEGFTHRLNLSEYIVVIMGQSERSPESHIWSYRLPAGPYAGSQWDLGGYILALGQVVSELYIALPDHHGTDLDQLAEVAGYEAEHLILFDNDRERYHATMVHGVGEGHPLLRCK